ncbi:rRNA pseudouridine synthase [Candidatus Woesearchaeota archaeon]|nr:rRNA pseudouridine synthase [Candidatus Woesearchaeota archaeon]
MERIQKIMSAAGIASRRKAEELIKEGRVTVNGKIVKLGDNAEQTDKILIDGKPIALEEKTYIMLNKPTGYVTTTHETHDMKTVMQLVPRKPKIYPIGRLDKNTEGLLLFTNDGNFANQLTHPRYNIHKEYRATLDKPLTIKDIEKITEGVPIDGKAVTIHNITTSGKSATITIHEGRKHIVRELFLSLGYHVNRLVRTKIASLALSTLAKGTWRKLRTEEVEQLRKQAKQCDIRTFVGHAPENLANSRDYARGGLNPRPPRPPRPQPL